MLELHPAFSVILVLTLIIVVCWLYFFLLVKKCLFSSSANLFLFNKLLQVLYYLDILWPLPISAWFWGLICPFLGHNLLSAGLRIDSTNTLSPLLTLFDGVIAVAVGVVGHVSEQRVVGVRVLGAQAVGVCGRVGAAPPCEFAWKVIRQINISGGIKHADTVFLKKDLGIRCCFCVWRPQKNGICH